MGDKQILHIDAEILTGMIKGGASNLRKHVKEINDLNVFPIPDGDTGDNMLMTIEGAERAISESDGTLRDASKKLKSGMLLSARGNSGVILSQFFAGIADCFKHLDTADLTAIEEAFKNGVKKAYAAVMVPTEGTILTVAKDATRVACENRCRSVPEFLKTFIDEAKESLERTPDLLAVLKEAGVVDSGGAGLIKIVEGMYAYVTGEPIIDDVQISEAPKAASVIDPDLFTEDTILEFGYCTEILLRLQNSKTNVEEFDEGVIIEYLQTIGDSIVCVKSGSIVKIHVHTMTPYKVLEFCQRYGEYLTTKIENMMIQHNEVVSQKEEEAPIAEQKDFGLVTVANGDGILEAFKGFGADIVISGGQTMNPSSQDFIDAFDKTNAKTIFVLPNNSNIILAAEQAAKLYKKADIRVIPTKTIGDAYAVLTMLDYTSENADEIEEGMKFAMEGVLTTELSKSIRDVSLGGVDVKKDDYIGIMGKNILSSNADIYTSACEALDGMELGMKDLLIIIEGKEADKELSEKMISYVNGKYPMIEISCTEGLQDIYNYIFVAE